jgi:hypothetical protein
MSNRKVNATFIKCDRCGREVEQDLSNTNTAGWVLLTIRAYGTTGGEGRNVDLCNPCTGIFNRMMETTT